MPLQVIPCAPGAHIGEQITLGFLKQNLNDGVILTNYHHPDQTGTLEIDLVVINYQGVWLLEVKHWWGKIKADPIHWFHAGNKHPSPITNIDMKAKVVHSSLRESGMGDVSVVGLVMLSKGTNAVEIKDVRADRVFGLRAEFAMALVGKEMVFSRKSPILSQKQIDRIVDILVRKHVDPEWLIIGNYLLVERLDEGEQYEAWEGQHLHVQSRRTRIKRYHIEAVESQKHLDENVRHFKQDMEALALVEGHPNIIQAYDFLADPDSDDTYWLLLEHVEGKTLRDLLNGDQSLSFDEQINVLVPVADALEYCHQRGILHRNLTPNAVYLADNGKVKVGDFDFARVPPMGFTISQTGQPLVHNRYIAPEQLSDPRRADKRADLYSLGAIWYDMIFQPQSEEPILIHRLAEADISKDAKELMKSLLANRPSDRPESATEVREWFELIKS